MTELWKLWRSKDTSILFNSVLGNLKFREGFSQIAGSKDTEFLGTALQQRSKYSDNDSGRNRLMNNYSMTKQKINENMDNYYFVKLYKWSFRFMSSGLLNIPINLTTGIYNDPTSKQRLNNESLKLTVFRPYISKNILRYS